MMTVAAMNTWKLPVLGMVLAGAVAAQEEVAPEIKLLARVKAHLRDEVAHLPTFTCLETITRFHKDPGRGSLFAGTLKPLDTVRLEIVYSDHREWFGSPGERKLTADNPAEFIGSGMIGNGAFGITLDNLLGATIIYRGEESLAGRAALRYDFKLPRQLRGLMITIETGTGTAGEEGSFWVDPKSLDLVRLESRAAEIPPYLPLEETRTAVDYARVWIGGYSVLLAQQGEMHMLESSGVENYDHLDFTHCGAFSAQSTVQFLPEGEQAKTSQPATATAATPSPGDLIPTVPPSLNVTMQLVTPITDQSFVGERIEGKVSGEVRQKGKVVIPDGSAVRGRIRRLERYHRGDSRDFIVELEFAEVEGVGGPFRFYADFLRLDRNPQIQPNREERILVPNGRSEPGSRAVMITLPELPGVASFFVKATPFTIPGGFRILWRTRGVLRGE